MRDRLIELLRDTFNYTKGVCIDFDEAVKINADHLLANGVVVPPCKVGDTVYLITIKRPCYACLLCTDFCHKYCTFDDKNKYICKKKR